MSKEDRGGDRGEKKGKIFGPPFIHPRASNSFEFSFSPAAVSGQAFNVTIIAKKKKKVEWDVVFAPPSQIALVGV